MSQSRKTVRRLLALSALALAVFALIAVGVREVAGVAQFDGFVADRLHTHAAESAFPVSFFLQFTRLGAHEPLIWISIAVAAAAILRRQWQLAAAFAIAQVVGLTLIEHCKLWCVRARPSYNGAFGNREDSYSFPSGHSLASMVAYGMMAYMLALTVRSSAARKAIYAAFAGVIVLIGFSRIYLGVHWFSDVLGGYALGLAWLLFAVALVEDGRGLRMSQKSSAGQ